MDSVDDRTNSEDKLAIITGASSGIGEEYAYQLAAKGYNLFLTARRESLLREIKKNIEERYRVKVSFQVADLSNRDDISKLCATIADLKGVILLINNAGFAVLGEFQNNAWEKHEAMLDVHMLAPTQIMYTVIPKMIDQRAGNIINVGSMAGLIKGRGVYGATKSYLTNLSLHLNKSLKSYNIHVQAFCPGYTYTGFHKTQEYKDHAIDAYSAIPSFAWMRAETAVSISLKMLAKNKVVVVPGMKNKVLLWLTKLGIISKQSSAQRQDHK